LEIQVWSDVVCPWCLIGKNRLDKAAAQSPEKLTVTFRAFQLDPSPVPEPLPIKEAAAAKFGGRANADQMFDRVTAIAAGDRLTLDYDHAVAANTFDAHRLVAWAAAQGRQTDMVEALQRAHFQGGIDVGSLDALAGVAASIGLDEAAALEFLKSDGGIDAVNADLAEARELGITSVPTFVIDGKYAIQGAQEVSTLVAAFEEIARREAAGND
jgi:predicted DsbA family dithiol-disulfide isomerase